MDIQVRAFFKEGGPTFGFCGNGRRRDGDVFLIDENKFDPSWMEVVEAAEAEPAGGVDGGADEPDADPSAEGSEVSTPAPSRSRAKDKSGHKK
jgi:hypothetical protein